MNFRKFMNVHKTEGNDYTHTSMTGGKWKIDDKELDLFYDLYVKELEQSKQRFYLTERHQPNYGPIIIDFDIKYKDNPKQSPLSIKIIDKIVYNITHIIKTSFDKNENYMCVVLKRPNLYEYHGLYKDGIHICFPYIVGEYQYHHILRKKYLEIIAKDLKDVPFYIESSKNIKK